MEEDYTVDDLLWSLDVNENYEDEDFDTPKTGNIEIKKKQDIVDQKIDDRYSELSIQIKNDSVKHDTMEILQSQIQKRILSKDNYMNKNVILFHDQFNQIKGSIF